jgi:hypothetical protein
VTINLDHCEDCDGVKGRDGRKADEASRGMERERGEMRCAVHKTGL